MKNKYLYNQKSKEELLEKIKKEPFNRVTCSFYKYVTIDNVQKLRDQLYIEWNTLQVLGRIYVSKEGINAQISVPEYNFDVFKSELYSHKLFRNIPLKTAVEEGISFLKLTIKIKDEIVAYKVPDNEYDMNKVGKHLDCKKFNKAIDEGATVIDMRNYYEGEVGKFENAITPDVDTSMELLPEIKKLLENKEADKILMYCTGGIRCEKASAVMLNAGFSNVKQLKGGVLGYFEECGGSHWNGDCFVFDRRVALNPQLEETDHQMCFACREPLTEEELTSEDYVIGQSCPYCA